MIGVPAFGGNGTICSKGGLCKRGKRVSGNTLLLPSALWAGVILLPNLTSLRTNRHVLKMRVEALGNEVVLRIQGRGGKKKKLDASLDNEGSRYRILWASVNNSQVRSFDSGEKQKGGQCSVQPARRNRRAGKRVLNKAAEIERETGNSVTGRWERP